MTNTYISPCDGLSDSLALQQAVDRAAAEDTRTVIIPAMKIWHLDEAIRLPSFVTVILDGAQIEAKKSAFVSSDVDEKEMCLGSEAEGICLLGTKGASIKSSSAPQVHLQNTKEYKVAGIRFLGGEGLKLSHCRLGKVQHLRFEQSRYGIFLTEGCNNNLINDIFAETEEEAVLFSGGESRVWGRSSDIYDTSLVRLDAKTKGSPAVAVRTQVQAANLFFHTILDRTEGNGVTVELTGMGEIELRDLTLRGIRSERTTAKLDEHCDGVFLGNLQGKSPLIHETATRILVAEESEEISLPDFSENSFSEYVNANDFTGSSDHELLQCALNAAAGGCLVIPRYNKRTGKTLWEIDKTLIVPSDTTVILLDAHLRLKDFTYCNLFSNGKQPARNIRLLGIGSAVLDSGLFNGLKEKNAGKLGFGPITDNALLFFAGVEGLTVENLHLIQNRWYGVFCIGCRKGRLSDLSFCAHPNFPDMGGIRLHSGCQGFLIENVTGLTGEDTVLLTASEKDDRIFTPACTDISDVHIKTVLVNQSRASLLRILTRDGRKIHHVSAENLLDVSLAEQKKLPAASVLAGDTESANLSDLRLRDITGRGESTVQLGGEIERIRIENLHSFGSSGSAIRSVPFPEVTDYKLTGSSAELAESGRGYRARIKDLSANGIFFRCTQGSRYMRGTATSIITDKKKFIGCVMDLRNMKGENLLFENILAERIGQGFFASGKVNAEIRGFYAEMIGRELALCGKDCTLSVNGEKIPVKNSQTL